MSEQTTNRDRLRQQIAAMRNLRVSYSETAYIAGISRTTIYAFMAGKNVISEARAEQCVRNLAAAARECLQLMEASSV